MHDFPSDAFGRPVNLQELAFWTQVDLQTLRAELKARIKEVNAKIQRDEARGVWNKRLLNARTYLQTFYSKAHEELENQHQDQKLRKREKDLAAARQQVREQREAHLKTQFRLLKFQHLLCERFGTDVIQELADEAHRLVP